MEDQFSRTRLLLGQGKLERLKASHVAIFGLGGVGSYVAESLTRSGVGSLTLVDADVVNPSNLNRQLIATYSTIGKPKVQAMQERLLDINPNLIVYAQPIFYASDTDIDLTKFDYIVDAIDTVTSKLILIVEAKKRNIPIISSMGAGNKLDPLEITVADIYNTSVCPLAKVMRHELRKRGIPSLKVVYSKEEAKDQALRQDKGQDKSQDEIQDIGQDECQDKSKTGFVSTKRVIGSIAFVPGVAGLVLASEVVKELLSDSV